MRLKEHIFSLRILILWLIVCSAVIPVLGQETAGTIPFASSSPKCAAVYETGDRLFVCDNAATIHIYNGTTLTGLGTVPLDSSANSMVVHEGSGKLYAAINALQKVAVINAATGTFSGYLSGTYPNSPILIVDESLGKLYILPSVFNTFGLWQVDTATDAETYIPGFDSGAYVTMALNPVTHELFLPYIVGDGMSIVDGVTLATSTVNNLGAIDVGVNWNENKVYTIYPMKVYDRDTGTIDSIGAGNDACTTIIYNPTGNRMITSSEVNRLSTIIDCDTDEYFNLPMYGATTEIAVCYATNHVFYACPDSVGILDDQTQLLEFIPVNPSNSGIVVNQTTRRVFVLCLDSVAVIQDTNTMTRPPVYVGNLGFPKSIYVLDPLSKEVVDNLEQPPYGLADDHEMSVRPGGGRFYMPSHQFGFQGSIAVYAGCYNNALISEYGNGIDYSDARVAALNPDGSKIYLTTPGFTHDTGKVSVFDTGTETLITTIDVGKYPIGARVTPDGSKLYTADNRDDSVMVIDTSTNAVVGTIAVGNRPFGLALNPGGSKAYVANSSSNTVSVIDTGSNTVSAAVPVGSEPHWLAVSPDGRQVYVSNSGTNTVSVIDTGSNTVTGTVTLGSSPEGLCALPDGSEVYAATGETVSVIDTSDYSVTSVALPLEETFYSNDAASIAVADRTSRFAGRVMNSDGFPVNGASVRALQAGDEKGTADTDSWGDYAVFNLKPGTYDIEVSAAGHLSQTLTAQTVEIGRTNVLNFVLVLLKPEINIKQGIIDIPDGGSHGFGNLELGASTDVTFTIENTGSENLTLGGTPVITIAGADAAQFSVQQQPTTPVAPTGNTTFIIRFSPTSSGAKTASISIACNDTDENPYDITLNGTCSCQSPVISGQPQDQTIDYDTATTLDVTATGTAPLSYRWYRGTSGDTSTPVGTDSSSFDTPALTATASYWVRIDNPCGAPADSNTAVITVSSFGDLTGPGNQGRDIQSTADGGYIVTGASDTISNGCFDFLVLKLDADGIEEWRKNFGGIYDDRAMSIQQAADGGYILAGRSKSFVCGTPDVDTDFYAIKLNASGAEKRSKNFGGVNYDECFSTRQAADGGYIFAGASESFTHGGSDILVYKLKPSGTLQWKKNFGGSQDERACTIRQTVDGNFIIGGSSESFSNGQSDFLLYKIDTGGSEIWHRNFGDTGLDVLTSVEQTSDGGYVLLGYTDYPSNGGLDFLVYKVNGSGIEVGHKTMGGTGNDWGFSVRQTADKGYVFAGAGESYTNGGYDFLVYKLNAKGKQEWRKNFGGSEDDYAFSIKQTVDGGYIVVGTTYSYVHTPGETDILIYKLDADGNEEWHYNFGD